MNTENVETSLDPTFEPYRYEQGIEKAYLIGSEKNVVEITEKILTAAIFEDLFSNTVSGNMVLKDESNLIKDQGLNGADRLVILIGRENKTTPKAFEFLVNAHSYQSINESSELITLHFVSLPLMISKSTRLWGAYKGSIDSIAKNVFEDVTKNYTPSKINDYTIETPTFETDTTEGTIKVVSPGWTPFQLLAWLSGRATNPETSGSLFLFYQTLFDGYKFKCVEKLVKDGNVKEIDEDKIYYYGYSGAGFEKRNIKAIHINSLGDTLKGVGEQYCNLWQTDLINKKIIKRTYSSETSSQAILNDEVRGQLHSNNGFDFGFTEQRDKANLRAVIKNESPLTHDQMSFYTGNSLQRKYGMLRQIQTMSISIEVFADNEIKVGDVLEIKMLQKRGAESKDTLKKLLDRELSGRYLVAAKALHFTVDEVKMQLQLVKDSVLEKE